MPPSPQSHSQKSIAVVGGGIVGLATAMRVQERFPGARVTVLEKESRVGAHQSTHNSGVLHCGLYYKPGSLKAKMAVQGIAEMVAFCEKHEIPHEICGKLVVATEPEELPRLQELLARGAANGLSGIQLLDRNGIRAREPNAAGIAAAWVPQEGIVDYARVCEVMAQQVTARGGQIQLGARVQSIGRHHDVWVLRTAETEVMADVLITCAGLHADRVGRLAGANFALRILPFRGEYFRLSDNAQGLVRNLIYPVPDPSFPFLGVHLTRLIHGGIEAGPNAVLALAREGYRWRQINLRDLWDALTFGGLWRFMWRYSRMVAGEIARSFSKDRFCKSLQRLLPDLRPEHLAPGGAGVRAQAMTPAGELVQDFQLVLGDRMIHLLNAPSPAATASLAIGRHVAEQIPL